MSTNSTLLRSVLRRTLIILAVGLISASQAGAQVGAQVPGCVLAKLQQGTDPVAFAARYGLTVNSFLTGMNLACLQGAVPGTEPAVASQIASDPAVLYAEAEASTVSPEVYGDQFHFSFDLTPNKSAVVGSTAKSQVDVSTNSVSSGSPSSSSVTVAVIDTGASPTHPLLASHYLPGYNAIQPGALPNEVQDGTTNCAYGHGTMIAGIIVTLAPNVNILPVRVLNADGVGTVMNLVTGIQWAVNQGADVINLSLGTTVYSAALADAIASAQAAGVAIVASVGNNASEVVQYPVGLPGVIGVASVESNNTLSSFSSYGPFVDVVAPGDSIKSSFPSTMYAQWSGTSFAAPFVTAEAALLLSVNASLTPAQVSNWITGTAHPVDSLNPQYAGLLGSGIIDVNEAVFALEWSTWMSYWSSWNQNSGGSSSSSQSNANSTSNLANSGSTWSGWSSNGNSN